MGKATSCNQTGQIFKEIAQSLINSKYIAIGSFIRKLKARKDSAIAIKAGARKLAIAYYNALTKGIEYVEPVLLLGRVDICRAPANLGGPVRRVAGGTKTLGELFQHGRRYRCIFAPR